MLHPKEEILNSSLVLLDYDELQNLTTHLDNTKYLLGSVQPIQGFNSDYKDFCNIDKNLETGKKGES